LNSQTTDLVERLETQAALYERDMGETEAMLFREAAAALRAAEQEIRTEKAAREHQLRQWQQSEREMIAALGAAEERVHYAEGTASANIDRANAAEAERE
jgi:hypothetical protein